MSTENYEKYLVKKPIRQTKPDSNAQNRTNPPLIYLSEEQVPGVKFNIEFGWVWGMPGTTRYPEEQVGEYDEIILNIGGDYSNPNDLGADIEFTLGGQVLSTGKTGSIFIPKGVKHGPLVYKNYRHPHVRISILLGTGDRKPKKAASPDHVNDTGIDYEKYLVKEPVYECVAGTVVKNRQEPASMTFMNRNLVADCNIYIEGGWVFGMPEPNPHIFDHLHREYEELVLHFGTDYKNPEELGGVIDFYVGGQPLTLDKTAMVYVPVGIEHGPLIWKDYKFPHLEMAMIPGATSLIEADPGGHQEKMSKEGKN
ncbi:MAG: hypothetical protein JW864_12225 [Spirochaetes bacterium]|nr:hypothetical protein [Spirochaetota bacterium]